MELDKAIQILLINLNDAGREMPPDCRAALKLGIKALKRVQWHKAQHPLGYYEPLPGEGEGE